MNTEQEREAFKKHYGALFDLTETPDAWGNPRFAHESVEAILYGWRDRAALQSQDREDAERYRWLRNRASPEGICVVHIDYWSEEYRGQAHCEVYDGEFLDKAIDHARRVEGEGE